MTSSPVTPHSAGQANEVIADAIRRFREDGVTAEPAVLGESKPEAVVIPFDLYVELLPVIEDLTIAHLVRQRASSGPSVPLADVAASLGLRPDDYR